MGGYYIFLLKSLKGDWLILFVFVFDAIIWHLCTFAHVKQTLKSCGWQKINVVCVMRCKYDLSVEISGFVRAIIFRVLVLLIMKGVFHYNVKKKKKKKTF